MYVLASNGERAFVSCTTCSIIIMPSVAAAGTFSSLQVCPPSLTMPPTCYECLQGQDGYGLAWTNYDRQRRTNSFVLLRSWTGSCSRLAPSVVTTNDRNNMPPTTAAVIAYAPHGQDVPIPSFSFVAGPALAAGSLHQWSQPTTGIICPPLRLL